VILGTAAYMSPEQARGQKVDRRADIWSFGVVLYEMLTGKSVYSGETVSDVLAKVLEREPDWESLPKNTPASTERLLRRCFEKNVRQRLQSMGDARIVIDEYLSNPAAESTVIAAPVAAAAQPAWRRPLPWALAGVLAATVVALAILWPAASSPDPPMRLNVELTAGTLFTNLGAAAVVSGDGTRLAYAVGNASSRSLHVRSLDRLEGISLSGTEQAYHPFFSPDGKWVGFVTRTELKKVSVSGGAPLTLCNVAASRGASWGPDDTIVFAPSPESGLFRVRAAGGDPEEVTLPDKERGEVTHRWPQVLPGGKAALFTSHTSSSDFDSANIEVVDLETGERKLLHQGGSYARYVETGHLVYVREGTLFAAGFDLDRLEMTGSPAPIIEGVMSNSQTDGGAQFDVSQSGKLIYLTGTAEGPRYQLVWSDRKGNATPLSEDRKEYDTPRFSPDGTQLAIDIGSGSLADVWVYDLRRSVWTRLTFGDGVDFGPFWSADGQYVGFSSNRDGSTNLYWKRADGSGEAERLTESSNFQSSVAASPDGKYVMFHELTSETNYDLWVLPLEGERKPELFLQTPFAELEAEFSPNGRWVAYHGDESGRFEVYVRPFPKGAGKWQISTDGGTYARWSRDGRELYFRTDRGLMVVSVETEGATFRADKPEQLFEGPFARISFAIDYDVGPDGQRFVMLKSHEAEDIGTHTHVTMVTNWFEELRHTFATAGN
jgi:serine/threonine-protein kinase